MSSLVNTGTLPEFENDWKNLIRSRGLRGKSIHETKYDESASSMGMDQFLLLQVLWRSNPLEELEWVEWLRDKSRTVAVEHLKPDTPTSPWSEYLISIGSNTGLHKGDLQSLSEFAIVRQLQLPLNRVLHVPLDDFNDLKDLDASTFTQPLTSPAPRSHGPEPTTPTSAPVDAEPDTDLTGMELDSSPLSEVPDHIPSPARPMTQAVASTILAVKDEEIVNISLLVFLQALIVHCSSVHGEWSPHRKPFVVKTLQNAKIYEARVDGYLETSQGRIRAIVEVKPYIRYGRAEKKIRIQESAEMAAWIFEDAPEDFDGQQKRLLVSQDRQEVYLTIATYDKDYVKYIRGQKTPGCSFLQMADYGPYNMFNWKHVRLLGELLLGFSIQECPEPEAR